MTTQIVNATPHAINVFNGNKIVATFEPSGIAIRVLDKTVNTGEFVEVVGVFDNAPDFKFKIPITVTTMTGDSAGSCPPEEEGKIFIVSRVIAEAFPDRKDFFIPNEAVRNDKGQIIGCRSFGRIKA